MNAQANCSIGAESTRAAAGKMLRYQRHNRGKTITLSRLQLQHFFLQRNGENWCSWRRFRS